MIGFVVNGRPATVDVPPETPLPWAIRERLDPTGAKLGCGAGLCGARMVHSGVGVCPGHQPWVGVGAGLSGGHAVALGRG